MGTGREAEDQDSRIRVSEARDRLPPVFVVAIGATLFACDLFAIRNKAGAASTGDNLAVELGEPVGGHDASVDEPKANEIYQVGTIVNIVQSLKLPDGNIKVLVEGIERGKVLQIVDTEGFMEATVRVARYATETNAAIEASMQRVTTLFEQYVKLCQSLNYETMIAAVRMEDPAKLTDTIAANLQLSIEEKQELLEIFDPAERLNRIGDVLDIEIEKLNMHGCYVEMTATSPVGTVVELTLDAAGVRVHATGEVKVSYPFLGMGIALKVPGEEQAGLREMLQRLAARKHFLRERQSKPIWARRDATHLCRSRRVREASRSILRYPFVALQRRVPTITRGSSRKPLAARGSRKWV